MKLNWTFQREGGTIQRVIFDEGTHIFWNHTLTALLVYGNIILILVMYITIISQRKILNCTKGNIEQHFTTSSICKM